MTEEFDPDGMDLNVGGHVIAFRRKGNVIDFGITPGPVVRLSSDDAEFIARTLLAAALKAKQAR